MTGNVTVPLFFVCLTLFLCLWFQLRRHKGQVCFLLIPEANRGADLPTRPDGLNPYKQFDMGDDTLQELAGQAADNVLFTTKEVLTSQEAARYMGISLSHLYKLTMRQEIPHYKPMGKLCYFNRHELEEWLQSNRINTGAESVQQARAYCMRKGGTL